MYTHMRPQALQALFGCQDKEVGNYREPLMDTVLGLLTFISSFGSLERAVGPSFFRQENLGLREGEFFMLRCSSVQAHRTHRAYVKYRGSDLAGLK